jgi:hypothetical protein
LITEPTAWASPEREYQALVSVAERPAEAGADRIDEHQVEGVERAVGVVAESRSFLGRFRRNLTHRSQTVHVQRRGRGARTAVVDEHHRTLGPSLGVARVGDRDDLRPGLSVPAGYQILGDGGRVGELLTIEDTGMFSNRDLQRRETCRSGALSGRRIEASRQGGRAQQEGNGGGAGKYGFHAGFVLRGPAPTAGTKPSLGAPQYLCNLPAPGKRRT